MVTVRSAESSAGVGDPIRNLVVAVAAGVAQEASLPTRVKLAPAAWFETVRVTLAGLMLTPVYAGAVMSAVPVVIAVTSFTLTAWTAP